MNASARTPREILESFCCNIDLREWMKTPWLLNGMAYATNGHWMVRMPADGLGDLTPFKPGTHPKNFQDHFDAASWDTLKPLAPVECPACNHCKGTGRMVRADCPACTGKGVFQHHGVDYDCETCYCQGWLQRLPDAAKAEIAIDLCEHCTGTGCAFSTDDLVQHSGVQFQRAYVAALSRLPGIEFGANSERGAFRFAGGCGVLMPCRRMSAKDYPEVGSVPA